MHTESFGLTVQVGSLNIIAVIATGWHTIIKHSKLLVFEVLSYSLKCISIILCQLELTINLITLVTMVTVLYAVVYIFKDVAILSFDVSSLKLICPNIKHM